MGVLYCVAMIISVQNQMSRSLHLVDLEGRISVIFLDSTVILSQGGESKTHACRRHEAACIERPCSTSRVRGLG